MASLEAALKRAIQLEYQLEDSELATEPLPTRQKRRHLLFYEAAEGGAGVLRQLVEDPSAWTRVARTALKLCHFDPETGTDFGKGRARRGEVSGGLLRLPAQLLQPARSRVAGPALH